MQKFNGSIFKNALVGGLYFHQAPQDVESPYGVFYFVGTSYDEYMGGAADAIIEIDLQFSIFSNADDGGSDIALLAERLTDTYDWQQLNVDGYKYIKMQREGMSAIDYTDNVWQAVTNYVLGIVKE